METLIVIVLVGLAALWAVGRIAGRLRAAARIEEVCGARCEGCAVTRIREGVECGTGPGHGSPVRSGHREPTVG